MDETVYQDIEQASIEMLAPEHATITVDIDAQCFFGSAFGAPCAKGGGAEATDARTFITVDTGPIGDSIECAASYVCVTIFAAAAFRALVSVAT